MPEDEGRGDDCEGGWGEGCVLWMGDVREKSELFRRERGTCLNVEGNKFLVIDSGCEPDSNDNCDRNTG